MQCILYASGSVRVTLKSGVKLGIPRCVCKIYEIGEVRAMLIYMSSSPSNFVHRASKDTAGHLVQTQPYANACMLQAHPIKISEPVRTFESACIIAAE